MKDENASVQKDEILDEGQLSREKKLYCSVVNTNALEIGLESDCTFDKNGGSIGSSKICKWVLTDVDGNIYANHCEIKIIDHEYCLIDYSGKMTVNYSTMPIEANSPMVISANDVFSVGPYQVKTHFVYNDSVDSLTLHKQTLGSIFKEEMRESNLIPDEDDFMQGELLNKVDPLLALQDENGPYRHIDKHKNMAWDENKGSTQSDYQYHMDAVISRHPEKSTAQSEITNSFLNTYSEDFVDDHLATGPIMRGLKVKLSHSDNSGEMQYVAEEIGESLRQTIKGLLKIHKQVDSNRYGMMNKNFQPIIDNPLKMALTYEEVVHLMYDDSVSLVHLSPAAAIKESLDTIFNHQEAVHHAITEALDQILVAFSPESLMKRFNYYRTSRRLTVEEKEAWAWKMYQAYYLELISNRQTGFKKLFWEIFDQVYDKKIRELQNNTTMEDDDE